jgi:hypothetical protein
VLGVRGGSGSAELPTGELRELTAEESAAVFNGVDRDCRYCFDGDRLEAYFAARVQTSS